jgi:hypothetical protein
MLNTQGSPVDSPGQEEEPGGEEETLERATGPE